MTEFVEAAEYIDRIARLVGRVLGITLGVDRSGDRLIFVDVDGEPIQNDGEEIIAATAKEIEEKQIGEVSVRALRAAGIAKFQEIERSRTP